MREIKFRGKRVDNGEWVHGDLIQLHDGRMINAYRNGDDLKTINGQEKTKLRLFIMSLYKDSFDEKDTNQVKQYDYLIKSMVGTEISNCFIAEAMIAFYFEECDVYEK